MDIFDRSNWDKLATLIPEIKKNINEWRVINMVVQEKPDAPQMIDSIAAQLKDFMGQWSGALFVYSRTEIICFARMGALVDMNELKDDVVRSFSGHHCEVKPRKPTGDGIQRIEIILAASKEMAENLEATERTIHARRAARREKVIMVVDDDMFVRSLVANVVKAYARVVELDNGQTLLERYIAEAPNLVILDIHMPGKTGIELLRDIMRHDSEASVIMLSADSIRDNVIETTVSGAKWFLTKPVTKDKIIAALRKCPGFMAI